MIGNEYARATGKETHPHPSTPLEGEGIDGGGRGEEKRRPRELSEDEKLKVACTAQRVELHMPEVVPLVKELHALGMIDGWRNVKNFRFKEGS
ncbi:MAG: hypothetical protein KJ958_05440 [Gammaproteobacteria bacterium]|nr:hypothetical protein [Gammaproteobacteria bacterium]MBU1978597.1 hypothetical protein [Gammaproteobacteria bacterium]